MVFVAAVWGRDYEVTMGGYDKNLLWGASSSRNTARMMNRLVRANEKALMTPMHYWSDQNLAPCPIFVYYLKDIPVVVRPFTMTPEDFERYVMTYELDWAMLSPEPGVGEKALIEPIIRKHHINPLLMKGACIFHTTSIYKKK